MRKVFLEILSNKEVQLSQGQLIKYTVEHNGDEAFIQEICRGW